MHRATHPLLAGQGALLVLHGLESEGKRRDGPGDQDQERHRYSDHEPLVSPGELLELIERARRVGENRLIGQIAPDIRGQFRCGRVPSLAVLLDGLVYDSVDVAAKDRPDRSEPGGLLLANDASRLGNGFGPQVEGRMSGEQLVENDTDRVDVAAGIQQARVAGHLLRAHVRYGSNELSHIGPHRGQLHIPVSGSRHTEVEHLGLAQPGER